MSDPVEPQDPVEPVELPSESDAKSAGSGSIEPATTVQEAPKHVKMVSMFLDEAAEANGAVDAYESEQSLESLLTRVTICSDDTYKTTNIIEPFCLAMVQESNSQMFEDITLNFPPNKDPGIYTYMDIVEVDL